MTISEDGSHDGIMSERTLNIAGRIYNELQSMIQVYGDEVIAELMPLIVNVLEELDVAFQDCDDAVRALEELRDELSQCKQEIKRQKQLRELIEEEKMSSEEMLDGERRRLLEQHSQLQTLNRSMTLNLSAKQEYIQNLEGRMVELERDHRDLERRHVDTIQQLVKSKKTIREQSLIIDRSTTEESYTPHLMLHRAKSHPISFLSVSDPGKENRFIESLEEREEAEKDTVKTSTPIKPKEEKDSENVKVLDGKKGGEEGSEIVVEAQSLAEEVVSRDRLTSSEGEDAEQERLIRLGVETVVHHGDSDFGPNLFDELNGVVDLEDDEQPLKNSLLIKEAPESSHSSRRSSIYSAGDNELQNLLREKQDLEEIRNKLLKENNELLTQLQQSKTESEASSNKITILEVENKNISEKISELETSLKNVKSVQHPLVLPKPEQGEDAKRFTRSEMDKVIREKNMYKEKYLELQEDLSTRYVEVQNEAPNEKSKFWNLFSGLFARRRAYSETTTDGDKKMRKLPDYNEDNQNKLSRQRNQVMSRHFIQGWSLSHEVATQSLSDMDFIQSIPAPIYCGPLGALDNERKSLVRCCATANEDDPFSTRYMTWVCCEREGQGEVFIVDPTNPTEIKDNFVATKSAIICISYVSAAVPMTELEMKVFNNSLADMDLSDSDNENGEFEICDDTGKEKHLLVNQPTFWLGTQSGFVVVHSAVEQCDTLLTRVRLKDSILEIKYIKEYDMVLVGCADGTIAIFTKYIRTSENIGWDMENYRVIVLGKSMSPLPVSVIAQVKRETWVGYGGNIAVLTLPTAEIKEDIIFSDGNRSLVTHMVPVGAGVWVACRFNSILTLLDAKTCQPLQQVNMEDVLKPVSMSYGFTSLIRVSAVLCYNDLLWVGTSQGAMVTIPLKSLSSSTQTSYITEPPMSNQVPMFAVRDEARISLHGHQGAVRYIIVARYNSDGDVTDSSRKFSTGSQGFDPVTGESGSPRKPSNPDVLLRRRTTCTRIVLSGGEGYISYRDMDAGTLSTIRRGRIIRGFTDHCHMIAWDVSGPLAHS